MLVSAIILGIIGILMIFFRLSGNTDIWGRPYAGIPSEAIMETIFVIVSVILFVVWFVFM